MAPGGTDMAMTIAELKEVCERRRRGVTDPQRLTAAELQNITDILLEFLESKRREDEQPAP
jgi:hypothetical protein